MSPRKTFHSCGSSSRLVLRKNRPTRVTRGSTRSLWYFTYSSLRPASSASISSNTASAPVIIVRNLMHGNGTPSLPIRQSAENGPSRLCIYEHGYPQKKRKHEGSAHHGSSKV